LVALGGAAPVMPPEVQAAAVALGVLPVFLDYLSDVPRRAWRRVKVATDEATDRLGDAEELLRRIRSDDLLLWQFDTTVEAAASASTEQKARALGRALAEGALADNDAGRVQAALMTRIISDVEPIDLRVLAGFSDLRHGRNVPPDAENDRDGNPAYLWLEDVAQVAGLDPVLVVAPLSVLLRHGLIDEGVISANRGSAWCITDLGDRLLDYLRLGP